LADSKFFDRLNKKPIIINTSRGEVVDTWAIKNAFRNNKIKYAVLDVWENEPDIDIELLKMADISTPHIAGYSADGKANGTSVCVNAVNEFFNLGKKQNWYPDNIPNAKVSNKINIDCENKSDQQIIKEAVFETYNIFDDVEKLKTSPETFEEQRGDYPIRREFDNYRLTLYNGNESVVKKLEGIGFKVDN